MAQVAQGAQLQSQDWVVVDTKDYDRIGKYAVDEANKKYGWHLKFKCAIEGSKIHWLGVTLYSLTIEATNWKLYQAFVWETQCDKGLISFIPLLRKDGGQV